MRNTAPAVRTVHRAPLRLPPLGGPRSALLWNSTVTWSLHAARCPLALRAPAQPALSASISQDMARRFAISHGSTVLILDRRGRSQHLSCASCAARRWSYALADYRVPILSYGAFLSVYRWAAEAQTSTNNLNMYCIGMRHNQPVLAFLQPSCCSAVCEVKRGQQPGQSSQARRGVIGAKPCQCLVCTTS